MQRTILHECWRPPEILLSPEHHDLAHSIVTFTWRNPPHGPSFPCGGTFFDECIVDLDDRGRLPNIHRRGAPSCDPGFGEKVLGLRGYRRSSIIFSDIIPSTTQRKKQSDLIVV